VTGTTFWVISGIKTVKQYVLYYQRYSVRHHTPVATCWHLKWCLCSSALI